MNPKKPLPPEWLALIQKGDHRAIAWALALEERGGLRGGRRLGVERPQRTVKTRE